jgi:hypothetical protein
MTPRGLVLVLTSDGYVVGHQGDKYSQFGVGKGDSNHAPGGIAVVTAGGLLSNKGPAMMRVDFGQEFRRCRETAAINQDVDWPSECRLARLLQAQVGMTDYVDWHTKRALSRENTLSA